VGCIFQKKFKASHIVPVIIKNNFKSNDTKMFSQYDVQDRKFSHLPKSLADKVREIAKSFIANKKDGK
jgi:hypothetical protein